MVNDIAQFSICGQSTFGQRQLPPVCMSDQLKNRLPKLGLRFLKWMRLYFWRNYCHVITSCF